jgi:hypothetical protein
LFSFHNFVLEAFHHNKPSFVIFAPGGVFAHMGTIRRRPSGLEDFIKFRGPVELSNETWC